MTKGNHEFCKQAVHCPQTEGIKSMNKLLKLVKKRHQLYGILVIIFYVENKDLSFRPVMFNTTK